MLFIEKETEYEKSAVASFSDPNAIPYPLYSLISTAGKEDTHPFEKMHEVLSEKFEKLNHDYLLLMNAWLEHLFVEYGVPPMECETGFKIAMDFHEWTVTKTTEFAVERTLEALNDPDLFKPEE